MCGIVGFLTPIEKWNIEHLESTISRMTDSLQHRGPDDRGIWCDTKSEVALGHRRLSILDLSAEGHQPMHSANGRYTIVYNGEVYNFATLRDQLADLGYTFRGHSDTEVILAAIEEWGLVESVQRFVGMFAFALWDAGEKTLHLVRDRLGIKPLYYGWHGNSFLFASELKALGAFPTFQPTINRDALCLFLRHNYVPTPYSIYQDIYKLPPGCLITIPANSSRQISPWPHSDTNSPTRYWQLQTHMETGHQKPFEGTYQEAVDSLQALLSTAVTDRMVADVPLGAFLSGGIDSSLIVALMQKASSNPIRTFTIGFDDQFYNEAKHAAEVAQHLGTDHTEWYVTANDALDVIPHLPQIYDEPFSDSSQIPTYLVSKLTRRHVTVALSGDGGDELFAGYRRYFQCMNFWNKVGIFPLPARKFLEYAMVKGADFHSLDSLTTLFKPFLPTDWTTRPPTDSLKKLSLIVGAKTPYAFYRGLTSHWKNPPDIVLDGQELPTYISEPALFAEVGDNFTRQMMYFDLMMYHPDDILTKVDRASMAVGLEARVPLIDHRVVEFSTSLPLDYLIHRGQGKRILRDILYQHVPQEVVDRPKKGFGVPLGGWLRNELRDWAEELLSEKRLREQGYFNPLPIRQKWVEHLSGRRDWKYYLWDILMFEAWLDAQI